MRTTLRITRREGSTTATLIAFEVALDWARRVGLRYIDHVAKVAEGRPGRFGPRWRGGWEPVHVFARPGGEVFFDPDGYTLPAVQAGKRQTGRGRKAGGFGEVSDYVQPDERHLSSAIDCRAIAATIDQDHPAPFARALADAFVLCYSRPGEWVGDCFVGSGTVAESCNEHGRRFVGGDLGHRERDGRRWADVVRERVAQRGLFES